jgi:hypothetical protein
MRFITNCYYTIILISFFVFFLAGCTKNIKPELPESELKIEDKLPIRIGLLLDEKTRNYVYSFTGKFPIGKALHDISIEALNTMFSRVEEIKTTKPLPSEVLGVIEVKLLGFHMTRRGMAHDSYIVLEAKFMDDEGNEIWRDLILGEGNSGVFWGDRVESVEIALQDAVTKLVYGMRKSDEIKEFAIRKFLSESSV